MDVYTTRYQPPELRNHMLPAHWGCFSWVRVCRRVWWRPSVDCPLLSRPVSLFVSPVPSSLGPPPRSLLSLSSSLLTRPSPALTSNGLNRLAPCQGRGLLWLCHKSARKNRNHLFRPGSERGWGCKYTSLALALGPARTHRTTESTGGSDARTPPQPAPPPTNKLQSAVICVCLTSMIRKDADWEHSRAIFMNYNTCKNTTLERQTMHLSSVF